MKGHATIELTDVATGKKNVLEEDNLITNAVAEVLRPDLNSKSLWVPYSASTPVGVEYDFRRYFGGLFLFDTTLEESADNILPPYGAHLTGRGSDIAYSGTDTQLGSYNSAESSVSDDSITMVWDFTTSQANGTIASLALTSFLGGRYGLGSKVYDSTVFSETINIGVAGQTLTNLWLAITDEYDYNVTFGSLSAGTLLISRIKRTRNSLKILSNNIETVTITLSEEFNAALNSISTSVRNCQVNIDGQYIYVILGAADNIQAGGNIYIIKIDTADYSFEEITLTNRTGGKLKNASHGLVTSKRMIVVGDYLYAFNTDYIPCRINITNDHDYAISDTEVTIGSYSGQLTNNIVCANGVSSDNVFIEIDTFMSYKIYNFIPYNIMSNMSKKGLNINYCNYFASNNYKYVSTKNPFYLATINNLSSPVTKTSAQTMKVTYTLTEV